MKRCLNEQDWGRLVDPEAAPDPALLRHARDCAGCRRIVAIIGILPAAFEAPAPRRFVPMAAAVLLLVFPAAWMLLPRSAPATPPAIETPTAPQLDAWEKKWLELEMEYLDLRYRQFPAKDPALFFALAQNLAEPSPEDRIRALSGGVFVADAAADWIDHPLARTELGRLHLARHPLAPLVKKYGLSIDMARLKQDAEDAEALARQVRLDFDLDPDLHTLLVLKARDALKTVTPRTVSDFITKLFVRTLQKDPQGRTTVCPEFAEEYAHSIEALRIELGRLREVQEALGLESLALAMPFRGVEDYIDGGRVNTDLVLLEIRQAHLLQERLRVDRELIVRAARCHAPFRSELRKFLAAPPRHAEADYRSARALVPWAPEAGTAAAFRRFKRGIR